MQPRVIDPHALPIQQNSFGGRQHLAHAHQVCGDKLLRLRIAFILTCAA
jgi:hypothetical protein